MQSFSVLLTSASVCVYALDSDFVYVSEKVLPRFQTEQERDVYILDEETSPNRLCSVLFMPVAKRKTVHLLFHISAFSMMKQKRGHTVKKPETSPGKYRGSSPNTPPSTHRQAQCA
ncbi:MAG: uncharacterized protein A8A55_2273 [Amphiamblys sp. WSBS2006]|nr:MAG: uncharacterized protein A8A55_2273 [Amphiamblys sp. WSBS2006]